MTQFISQAFGWALVGVAAAGLAYYFTAPKEPGIELEPLELEEEDNLELDQLQEEDLQDLQDQPQAGQPHLEINPHARNRAVGPKKAKSLARRDERRRYFEYVRQRAEEQRILSNEADSLFGDMDLELRMERTQRINDAAAALRSKQEKQRKERDLRNAASERRRRELVSEVDSHGFAKLKDGDDAWGLGYLTSDGFVVDVGERHAKAIAQRLAGGFASYAELAETLTANQ